jgi:hypothetical protein
MALVVVCTCRSAKARPSDTIIGRTSRRMGNDRHGRDCTHVRKFCTFVIIADPELGLGKRPWC